MQEFNKQDYLQGLAESGVSEETRHSLQWMVTIDETLTSYGNRISGLLLVLIILASIALVHFW